MKRNSLDTRAVFIGFSEYVNKAGWSFTEGTDLFRGALGWRCY